MYTLFFVASAVSLILVIVGPIVASRYIGSTWKWHNDCNTIRGWYYTVLWHIRSFPIRLAAFMGFRKFRLMRLRDEIRRGERSEYDLTDTDTDTRPSTADSG